MARRPRTISSLRYALIAVAVSTYAAHAATVSWTADGSDDWSNPSNWSTNPSLPGPADDVILNQPDPLTVTLSAGTQTINSLTTNATSNLTISGGSLAVVTTAHIASTLTLTTGGTLSGGTWSTTGTGALVTSGGTLDGVALNTNLLVNNGTSLVVVDGLALNGTASVGDDSTGGEVRFQGNQTLSGSGSVVLGNFAAPYYGAPSGLYVTDTSGPATLTIGSGITVHGSNGVVGTFTSPYVGTLGSPDCTLVNQGTINADTAGGTLTINAGTLTNTGLLQAANGGTLSINATWSGTSGTLTENNSTLNLGGSFTQANLGTFSRTGGTVNITGTLTGGLALGVATGSWNLAGGTILGGMVTGTGGAGLTASAGTLDGVALNTNLLVNNGTSLVVVDGLALNGTASVGDDSTGGEVRFQGNQTLSGSGSVVLGNFAAPYYGAPSGLYVTDTSGPATLTIGSGITVHGSNGVVGTFTSPYVGTLGSPDCTLVNQGTINADTAGGTLTINAGTLTNTGLLQAANGGTLSINATWSGTSGTLTENNSTLNLGGSFTQANLGTFSRTGGTVNITGTLTGGLALGVATGSWNLAGGTILGGMVTGTGGAGLTASAGTLDGVALNTNLLVNNGTSLVVVDGLALNGTASVGDDSTGGEVRFQGNQTLSGSGSVVLGNFAAPYYGAPSGLYVTDTSGPATLTIGSGITVHGSNGVVGTFTSPYVGTLGSPDCTLVNQGTINADTAGGTLTINAGTLTNTGLLQAANGGTLSINATWSGTSGTLTENNSTLNLGGSFTQANLGTFSRTGGTVNITGTLTGGLALGVATGSWNLAGGTILGGMVTGTGGAGLTASAGTLDGVALNTNLLVNNGTSLVVVDGLALNGTASVGDDSTGGEVRFQGNQTLSGSGSVVLGNFAAPYYGAPSGLYVTDTSGPATLTIGSGITVHGSNGVVGTFTSPYVGTLGSPDCTLVNQGTINADTAGGTLTINAGTLTNTGLLQAANGGTLNLANILTTAQLGLFNSTSGTIQISGTLDNTASTLALSGIGNSLLLTGTLQNGTVSLAAGAQLSLSTGTLNISTLNVLPGGTLSQSAGNLTVPTILQSGGTISLGGPQILYAVPTVTITGGTTILTKDTTKVLVTNALTFGGTPNALTGTLDLTQNQLIVEPLLAAKSLALASLRNQAFYGRSHTAGIISSTDAPNIVIAVLDNVVTHFATFGGQSVDADAILLAPELLGDANLDGKVDLNDLNTILNNLGTANTNWTSGNFDDGTTIDLTDLNDVLNNLGTTFANPSTSVLSTQSLTLSTPTPEPASLSVLALGALLLTRRRTP